MDRKLVLRVSAYIYREFGIKVQEAKNFVLESKLERLVGREGFADLADFWKRLDAGEPGFKEMLARYITTGHTFFFRESDHFGVLVEAIQRQGVKDAHIWCAASSTGEEAYSIAISLMHAGIDSFKIVASDMNPDVLAAFNAGKYKQSGYDAMPKNFRRIYFTATGDGRFKPIPELRGHIAIKRINIMDEIRFPRQFDFVFCRNMLIYFDEVSRNMALRHLMDNLAKGGLLFLGHTEAILNPPPGLTRVQNSVYRKNL